MSDKKDPFDTYYIDPLRSDDEVLPSVIKRRAETYSKRGKRVFPQRVKTPIDTSPDSESLKRLHSIIMPDENNIRYKQTGVTVAEPIGQLMPKPKMSLKDKIKKILTRESVIQFPNRRQPEYMTPRQVKDSVLTITDPTRAAKWKHPEIAGSGGYDHPIEHIAHYLGGPIERHDDVKKLNDYNRRKQIAQQHYLNNKKDIDSHVSGIVSSLESLESKVGAGNFPDRTSQLMARKEVGLPIQRWKNVQDRLSTLDT